MSVSFCQFTDELDEIVFINPMLVRSFVSWSSYDDDHDKLSKIIFDHEHAIVVKCSIDEILKRLTL